MSDQTEHSPSFNEAPASWNVKYTLKGFECQLTLRSSSAADLMPKSMKAIEWLLEQSAVSSKPAHAPAPAPEWTVSGGRFIPAQPDARHAPAPAPAVDEEHTYEVIPVASVAHVVSEKGHHSLKVKGGRYSKFGVTAWAEVIPYEEWEEWPIGQEYGAPEGMRFAVVRDGKKVTNFRNTSEG